MNMIERVRSSRSRLIVTARSPHSVALPMTIVMGCVSDFMKNHHHQGKKMATLGLIILDQVGVCAAVRSQAQGKVLLARARPTHIGF
jgi:hypothetical protein